MGPVKGGSRRRLSESCRAIASLRADRLGADQGRLILLNWHVGVARAVVEQYIKRSAVVARLMSGFLARHARAASSRACGAIFQTFHFVASGSIAPSRRRQSVAGRPRAGGRKGSPFIGPRLALIWPLSIGEAASQTRPQSALPVARRSIISCTQRQTSRAEPALEPERANSSARVMK